MFQTGSIEESIYSKRNKQKFNKSYSSSKTKWFESFIEYFIADKDDKNHRKDNISISEKLCIDKIESEDIIEGKDE